MASSATAADADDEKLPWDPSKGNEHAARSVCCGCGDVPPPRHSVVIECFFSGMKYNQSTKRPNLSNETTACIVKTRVMTNPVVDPMAPTVAEVDWERARLHELPAGWGL